MNWRIAVLCFAATVAAQAPSGYQHWSATELKGFEKKLSPKVDAHKVATEQLANYGNHTTMVAHREASGEAELHERMADLFVVQSGVATLLVGGEMVDGKTTAPGEVRGPSIRGGVKQKLAAGDIVHIPAKIPHQLLLDSGRKFTYFVMKVESQ
jgi:mannose-6-phosphate isomerase-like protein (cupin superfamily)